MTGCKKMLDQSSKDATQDSNKHSLIWWMRHLDSWERIIQKNLRCIKNAGNNLSMKQMFDISEKLIVEQSDEIFGVNPINWEDSWWKQISLVSGEEVTSLSHAKENVFLDSVSCLGKVIQYCLGRTVELVQKIHHSTELWTLLTESQWNSSGMSSQDSPHCSSATKSKSSCVKWAINQRNLEDGFFWCRCSTCHGDLKTINRNLTPNSFLSVQVSHQEDGHSSVSDQKRSGFLLMLANIKENGTESQSWCWSNLKKANTQLSVPRVHCPEECSKAKEVEKCRILFCVDGDAIETVFRTIISFNQLSIHGAFSESCEEYSISQTSTGWLVVAKQSDPFVTPADLLITTLAPSIEIPAQDVLQKYKERVERLSHHYRVLKVCIDAGFLQQFFMAMHTEEFSQFTEIIGISWAHIDKRWKSSDPKGWIRVNTKIGPVLEVTTSL